LCAEFVFKLCVVVRFLVIFIIKINFLKKKKLKTKYLENMLRI
jgi:hypothetical protein